MDNIVRNLMKELAESEVEARLGKGLSPEGKRVFGTLSETSLKKRRRRTVDNLTKQLMETPNAQRMIDDLYRLRDELEPVVNEEVRKLIKYTR